MIRSNQPQGERQKLEGESGSGKDTDSARPESSSVETSVASVFPGFGPPSIVHTEEDYQALLRRLDLALGASSIGVWEHSLLDDTVTWDERMHRLYGTEPTRNAVPGEIWMRAVHPDDREAALSDFTRAIESKGSYRSEFRIILPDGSVRYIRSMANYFLNGRGEPGLIGAEWDVTEDVELARALAEQRRLAEERAAALQASREQIEFAADHDYLTGLPNRRLFDRLCRQFDEGGRGIRLAVMHMDLDRFKEANDEHGHEAGDMVLKAAARAIRSVLGRRDIAARMGGDEFVIVCADPESEGELRRRAHKLIERIGRGIEFQGRTVITSASLGIASGMDRTVSSLLKDADMALYTAKRRGRGRAVFFTPDLIDREPLRIQAAELRTALRAGEIRPFYRHQQDSRTGELAGVEAIACWDQPGQPLTTLDELMPDMREMGLLPEFELTILRGVIEDLKYWQEKSFFLPRVSVCVSGDFFASPLLTEEVRQADRLASRLCFELRASDSLKDITAPTLKAATTLKSLGSQIAVSGIRDGEGSLIGLLRLRPDRLKLDNTMLSSATSELEQARVLHAVSEFAHAFGMTIVAEDTDCPEQVAMLRTMGSTTLRSSQDQPPEDRASLPLPRLPLRA